MQIAQGIHRHPADSRFALGALGALPATECHWAGRNVLASAAKLIGLGCPSATPRYFLDRRVSTGWVQASIS
jgi:hypothetical protein